MLDSVFLFSLSLIEGAYQIRRRGAASLSAWFYSCKREIFPCKIPSIVLWRDVGIPPYSYVEIVSEWRVL